MKAYYYDNEEGDQRLPHDSGKEVTVDELKQIGVLYFHFETVDGVNALALERGYKNRDEITVSPEKMGDIYEEKVKNFFAEHLHEDEEIRYITNGRGYFDVRSANDAWIRIALVKNDMIILPEGIYHRFTTDENNYIEAIRLFKEEPKWTPLNRCKELDTNTYRKEYVTKFLSCKTIQNDENNINNNNAQDTTEIQDDVVKVTENIDKGQVDEPATKKLKVTEEE